VGGSTSTTAVGEIHRHAQKGALLLKSSVARMNFMDLGLLRNFLVILQCGSITDAADRLGVAQPSLSQQLLRLEDELKIKLFTRTARGVMATEGARIFEQHARTILRDFERAR
jgi:LysR family transcriptional regulator, nitrogen assimilation regulatory protein